MHDQIFLQHIFYARRLTGPGTALHALPCHNMCHNRADAVIHIATRRVVIYHKTPLWEAGRGLAFLIHSIEENGENEIEPVRDCCGHNLNQHCADF